MEAKFDLVKTRDQTDGGGYISKKGTKGASIELLANYIELRRRPDAKMNQYRVDFSIAIESTAVKRAVFGRLQGAANLPPYLFDGSVLLTTVPIFPHKNQNSKTFTSQVHDGGARQGDHKPCEITIKLAGEIQSTDFHYLQVLSLIKAGLMDGLQMTQLGRDYFDTQDPIRVPAHNLQIFPGYKSSIRQHENSILLNVEVTHKVVRTDTVLDQMNLMKNDRSSKNEKGELDLARYQRNIERALIGCIVITMYNKKTYRIDGIDFHQNAGSSFEKKDGSHEMFYEYYQRRYDVTVRDRKQVLLVSTPKERDLRRGDVNNVLLLPELCYMTGMTDEMRNNFKLMSALSEHTRKKPGPRVAQINHFLRRVHRSPSCRAVMKEWQMEPDNKLVALKGRVLDPVDILLGGDKKFEPGYSAKNAEWSKAFRVDRTGVKGMNKGAHIKRWLFLYPQVCRAHVENLLRELKFVAKGLNIQVEDPTWCEMAGSGWPSPAAYINQMRQCAAKYGDPNGRLSNVFHFVVTAINSDKSDHYATIKKNLYKIDPVPNQVLTFAKTLRNFDKHRTFATKILLQMSTKLGGIPWRVPIPPSDVCVMGYDTYHDTVNKKTSHGALVASVDRNLVKYMSVTAQHNNMEEMSNQIRGMFTKALRVYQKENGKLPKKILFYRDGVGDGQLQHVAKTEVSYMEKVLDDVANSSEGGARPELTVIVVSKRINTRFFAKNGNEISNPSAGTVVDDVVTLPERFDFFVVSQSVGQGTVNPTSYNVIHNEIKSWTPCMIQQITYRLTHLYFNWMGTVRVPAPCQYAHKLAYLIGESLHTQPNEHLQNSLYYL